MAKGLRFHEAWNMPNPLAFGILGLDQIKPVTKRNQKPLNPQPLEPLESHPKHDNLTVEQQEAITRLRANGAKGSTVFVASSRRSKRKQSNPQSSKGVNNDENSRT